MADKPSTIRTVLAQDGARLEYEVAGDGPPLVLLHGFLAGRRAFSRQVPAFAQRFRVIVPSARGHDGSDSKQAPDYGATSSDVDDLRALLAAEKVDRADVIAHSSGGATAFAFAMRHPDSVRRAVLVEPSLFRLVPRPEADESLGKMQRVVAAEPSTGPLECVRGIIALLGGAAWTRLDEAAQTARITALAGMAHLVAPHFRSLLGFRVADEDIRALRPPICLVYGAVSYPFERLICARLTALRPDLPLHMVEGAGHNVHRDRAEAFNALAVSFLAGETV
jgi:pimeloyl-ACP methyl ester carboxylesterase